jgi:hypothetical protein
MTLSDREVKEAALIGLRYRRTAIEEQIQQLEAELEGRSGRKGNGAASSAPTQKRVLSPAARRRIAAAQRKRWAAVRKAKKKSGSERD